MVSHATPMHSLLTMHSPEATHAHGEAHGAVLTKPPVVELILDRARYSVDRDPSAA